MSLDARNATFLRDITRAIYGKEKTELSILTQMVLWMLSKHGIEGQNRGKGDRMSRLPRDMVRKIKAMNGEEMFGFWKNLFSQGYEEGYDAGYAAGITSDIDGDDFVVMDEDTARARLTDDEFLRLIGGTQ